MESSRVLWGIILDREVANCESVFWEIIRWPGDITFICVSVYIVCIFSIWVDDPKRSDKIDKDMYG